MKTKFIYTLILQFFVTNFVFCQQNIQIDVALDSVSGIFHINQKIIFKNTSSKPISTVILNDWNNAYSNRKTKLGQHFSDQFIRNFHLSSEKERGKTTINSISLKNRTSNWNRIENQIDLIEINFEPLLPNQEIEIGLAYELKIPDAKFTRWGQLKENFYLKDCFLMISKIDPNSIPLTYSNENQDDAVYDAISELSIQFDLPKSFQITSNLVETSKNNFTISNCTDYQFSIEKNRSSFESFKNELQLVQTNLKSTKISEIEKALIIDKVIHFCNEKWGNSNVNKIVVSQLDYERNPFYGLNQLPSFLSPFPNSFLYELKFLKVYTHNYLKQNLNIDFRKDHYLLDAMQTYLIINYINENYPDLHLLGNLSQFKLTKGYQISKAKFNDQYHLAYLFMARKNLDQSLSESKDKLVKFNEQISSKYKAGLAFVFLDNYLKNNDLQKSITSFVQLNKTNFLSSQDFEKIVKSKVSKNVDWFFDEMIHSNAVFDYSIKNANKSESGLQFSIKNKSNSKIPFLISGYSKKEKVFEKWIDKPIHDSIISINQTDIDRLVINEAIFSTEINNRNNFKSISNLGLNKPIKFSFLRDIENARYTQVFYYPEIGFNVYDGAIISLSLNNKTLTERPFTYIFSPSLSTNTKTISGSIFLNYVFQHPNKKLFQTRLSLGSSYFHYLPDATYTKISPSLQFRFRENNLKDNKFKSLSFRQVVVNREKSSFQTNDTAPLNYSVFDTRFSISDSETAFGKGFFTNLQLAGNFGKLTVESSYRKLFENNFQIGFRFFAGTFLYNNSKSDFYSFGLDRPKDYLFDYQFYGRNEGSGFFSQQIIIAEGGFKSKFKNPYANQWISSIGTTASVWKWIQMYGDFGVYQNKGNKAISVFDSGFHLNIVPDYFEIYLPVYSSNGLEIKQSNYAEKIRFQFTLNPKILIGIFTRKWF